MNEFMDTGHFRELCCLCMQTGNLNISEISATILPANNIRLYSKDIDVDVDGGQEETKELTLIDLMAIFQNSQDFAEICQIATKICFSCLEQMNQCYAFHQRFQRTWTELRSHLDYSIIEEEFPNNNLHEIVYEEEEVNESKEISSSKDDDEATINSNHIVFNSLTDLNAADLIEELDMEEMEEPSEILSIPKEDDNHLLEENGSSSSLVVAQFLPQSTELEDADDTDNNIDQETSVNGQQRRFLTMQYKTVQVSSDRKHTLGTVTKDCNDPGLNDVYKCQYCGQAYINSIYLQLHQRRVHLCQFCTQGFKLPSDRYEHIRCVHKNYKCVICQKSFSNNGNLRAHQKRCHDLSLPAMVPLIDFKENTNPANNTNTNNIMNSSTTVVPTSIITKANLLSQDIKEQQHNQKNSLLLIEQIPPVEIVEKDGQFTANLDLSQNPQLLSMFHGPDWRNGFQQHIPDETLN